MKKSFLAGLVAAAALVVPSISQAADWTIDPAHSAAQFAVDHLMISSVRGQFTNIEGTVSYDPAKPEAIQIQATIDAASIDTRVKDRDDHLRSADFFDVENHPKLTFQSKSARKKGKGLELKGDLTLRGVTKPVTFTVTGLDKQITDPWGNLRVGGKATTKIDRKDFGISWNQALDKGGLMIGEEVELVIDVELVRPGEKVEKEAAAE